MKRPDLTTVDLTIERARELTMRRLTRPPLPAKFRRRRPFVPRDQRVNTAVHARDERVERRRRMADTPLECRSSAEFEQAQLTLEQGYLWAETRAATEVLYMQIRERMARRLDEIGNNGTQEPSFYRRRAALLRMARTRGTWGFNLETGKFVMRFDDRSGLTHLDPSEARRIQARAARRLVPILMDLHRRGFKLYTAVFSEPNAPAGRLAWGKRNLLSRFTRSILGRDANGIRRRDGGAFPEIVGAYLVQEDPLAADGQTWNVHANVIFVVDPSKCTTLPPDLACQLEINLPDALGKLPATPARDRTPPGLLSYQKLHYVWGKHQLKIRPLEARDDETLGKVLLETIKYRAKWISAKQLDGTGALRSLRLDNSGPGAGDLACGLGGDPGVPGRALHRCPADDGAAAGGLELDCGATGVPRADRSAPGIIDWPQARLIEWIDAGIRFRRMRGFGCLYRLGPDPLPLDDETLDRICGDFTVTLRGVVVRCTNASFAPVNLIHGVKSERDFPCQYVRSAGFRAREGPGHGL